MASIDLPKPAAKTGVARRVYIAAAAMIIAFMGTVVLVVEQSSREADKFALNAEMRSTQLEFDRLTAEIIRGHDDTSYWDDAVEAFQDGNLDRDFVDEEIVDWMLPEFGFEWAAAVDEEGKTTVAVIGEQVLEHPENIALVQANTDLIEKARELYVEHRVRTGDGFIVPSGHSSVVKGVQATAYRSWNGTPGLLIAQVILPESAEYAIPEGDATVLIAFKPMTQQIMADVGDRLGLQEPAIVPNVPGELPISHIELPNNGAAPVLAFRWHPFAPRPAILGAVAPFAIGLCALICAAMLYM